MMTQTCFQLFRLTNDGFEQSLGYFFNEDDANDALDFYSEIRYPNAYVDIREVE
jgi:hypothetical protein